MEKRRIITIGREFGSGGRELGKRIAEALNIAYYDKEILEEISKKTELAYEYVKNVVENKPIIYYPITIGNSFNTLDGSFSQNANHVYAEQTNVIRELANKSDCVIVGRCADYILKDMHPFRIYVYADMESKIKRCMKRNDGFSEKEIKKQIIDIDKKRNKYYQFFTSQKRDDIRNYDICINTSNREIKEVVNEIVTIFK